MTVQASEMETKTRLEPTVVREACHSHPDRPARFLCEKLQQRFCEECARCPRPTHCKYRDQCLIRAMEFDDEPREREPPKCR